MTQLPPAPAPVASLDAKATTTTGALRHSALSWLSRYALVVIWALLAIALSVVASDTFLQPIAFNTIFGTQSVLLILTLALLLPLSVGDFDMRVANTMGMSATLMIVINGDNLALPLPLPLALAATLGVGLLIGAVNGLLVVRLGIDSIIATLGMGTLLLGLANWISGSTIQTGVASALTHATNDNLVGLPLAFRYGIVGAAAL